VIHKIFKIQRKPLKRDWSEDLGLGASVGAGNYPAKYSFNIDTAFCDAAPTPDYVVYSTGLQGSPTQASVVAYDNLYFGCGVGVTPSVYWAYNTGGQILTSPVLSLDGSQVAFMQSTLGVASLVILKWARGAGTFDLPTLPAVVLPAAFAACPAPCMTELPIQDGTGGPLDDTTSSIYYDYTNDVGWVGGTNGWLHKFTGVFNGTLAEVTTGGFPAEVGGASSSLSSPVYDRGTDGVFVTDDGGFLYRVDALSGTAVKSGQLEFSAQTILPGPVVDTTGGFVYVFVADDASGSCTDGVNSVDCTAVYQFHTTFGAGTFGSETTIGASNVDVTPNPMFIGAVDSSYYSSPDTTGNLYVCGNAGANPILYQVAITAGHMPVSGLGLPLAVLAPPATSEACSPVTDLLNENTANGPSERLFVSVQNNGLPTLCAAAGCVMNVLDTAWVPDNDYLVRQQVLSPKGHIETVITAGHSALLQANQPAWTTQPGATVSDGMAGSDVIWIDQGAFQITPYAAWQASHFFGAVHFRVLDSNNNVETLSTAGTSAASPPTWNTTVGGTTTDGTAIWTNVGALATAALPVPGGTSGMIIDNMLNPVTFSGYSSIYFTTLSDQPCTTSGGTGGCAVQASQMGLN
jgi:hypothetical protein